MKAGWLKIIYYARNYEKKCNNRMSNVTTHMDLWSIVFFLSSSLSSYSSSSIYPLSPSCLWGYQICLDSVFGFSLFCLGSLLYFTINCFPSSSFPHICFFRQLCSWTLIQKTFIIWRKTKDERMKEKKVYKKFVWFMCFIWFFLLVVSFVFFLV